MVDKKNPLIRPFLKWAGGKRQLEKPILEEIRPIKYNRYYEPFVGGGAILFALQPMTRPVINDLNDQLITTYKVIKSDVDDLITLLDEHKRNNCKDYYYQLREMDRDDNFKDLIKSDPVVVAARMIYLNKTCYNGLYRVNSQGFFNTPYGRYENPSIYDEEVLRAIHGYFVESKITIKTGNFDKAVKTARKGDLVYFDPPYDSPHCTNFTGYQAGGFDHNQQTKLRDLAMNLSDKGVKCLLSNADTEFIRTLFADNDYFKITVVKARRMISSNTDTRGLVDEVLIQTKD